MADYTYPSNPGNLTFGDRDALDPSNPEKIIKGTQLDWEFDSLAADSATKLDEAAQAGDFTGLIDGGTIDGGTF